jgi:hypothetical protein
MLLHATAPTRRYDGTGSAAIQVWGFDDSSKVQIALAFNELRSPCRFFCAQTKVTNFESRRTIFAAAYLRQVALIL